jgi:hypothetical protein
VTSQWLGPILAFFEPLVELSDILFSIRLVLLVRDAVDPGTGLGGHFKTGHMNSSGTVFVFTLLLDCNARVKVT